MSKRHLHPCRLSMLATVVVLCIGPAPPASAQPRSADAPLQVGQWVSIFNGKDLSGWTPKIRGHAYGEDPDRTFVVRDGALTVDYSRYQTWGSAFGHLFYDRKLSHYRIRVEYRFTGEPIAGAQDWARYNSGIMLHAQPPQTMRKEQSFPVSLEMQLLGRGNDIPTNGNLCTPGTTADVDGKPEPGCVPTGSPSEPIGEWVVAEAEVRGGRLIRHFLDGRPVLVYTDARLDPEDADAKAQIDRQGGGPLEAGYIALQSESTPIQFRKVEIQLLDPHEHAGH